jgi:predicted RNase H-like nuclease (RuvC/YqgF family)
MTPPTTRVLRTLRRITVCVLAGMLPIEVGCVSQSAYERLKAQAQEDAKTLEVVRDEVKELDQQIVGLQAANRQEDATTAELRMALQHEEEQLPIMRERAEASLTSLKGQVTALMNQSWNLAHKIADLRHESASLQSTAAQYKQEMEEAPAAEPVAADEEEPRVAQATVAEPPALGESPSQAPIVAQRPEQVAPTPNLSSSAPSTPPSPTNTDPAGTDDSWVSMILSWLTTFWNWLLS